jgi:XTP/dITP diphosphohydrolase
MKLLVATRNAGKLAEARAMLAAAGIETVSPDDAGVAWSPAEELLESAETFEGNARRKAEYFWKHSGLPTVADDSGLEVISLGGLPASDPGAGLVPKDLRQKWMPPIIASSSAG